MRTKKIMTVRGAIPFDKVGVTSMHDHVLADLRVFTKQVTDKVNSPITFDNSITMENLAYLRNGFARYFSDNFDLTNVSLMTREVQYFKERGGNTILDPSPIGLRSDIRQLRCISENSDVNIIASTGFYREETWPVQAKAMNADDITSYILKEINHGIDDTDIRAGHIKTAIALGSKNEFDILAPIVAAANETGLLLTAHTSSSTSPEQRRQMVETFLQAGMNPAKLLLCHIQYTFTTQNLNACLNNQELYPIDLTWAKEVLDQGINICIDLFGYPTDNDALDCFGRSDIVKLKGLVELIRLGYKDQIVLGNDVYQKIMTRSYGGHGYARIIDYVMPALLGYGIDKKTLDTIFINNPAKLLQC